MIFQIIEGCLVGLVALFLLLLFIVVMKTLCIKPTSAKTAKIIEKEADKERNLRYAEKLSKMIRCETISSRESLDEEKFFYFHQVLKELYPRVHEACEVHEFGGNLLYRYPGKGNVAPIMFMSHQDVVEANGTWKEDPFSGRIADGVIWGRGTVDTKGSLSCIFNAIEELIEEGFVPEGDIYIASSCTEEVSGDGAPRIADYLKKNKIHLSMLVDEGGMIIDEPMAGAKGTYAMVGVLEKGYVDVKFVAKSRGGHASTPGRKTPLVRLGQFMSEIEKKTPFKKEFNGTVKEMFKRLSPNMNFGMRLIFSNLWLFGPLLKRVMIVISPSGAALLQTTIAFTTAKGADGLNVLPQEAYVTANMRCIPHQPTDESIALVEKIAKKYQLETQVIYKDYPCPVVNHKGEAFQKVEETIHELFPGIGVVPYTMTGGTDAKFYNDVCDNCIRFAPLYITKQQLSSIHGLDENLNINTLGTGTDFFKIIAKKM